MTHIIRPTPTQTTHTIYHDGDDVVFYPTFTTIRLSREEAERLARYLAPHIVSPPPEEAVPLASDTRAWTPETVA